VPPRWLFASGKFDQYKRESLCTWRKLSGLIRALLGKRDSRFGPRLA